MSRREDLENHIRESYGIIREYEAIRQVSDRPEEKQRARRLIDAQWALIEGYLAEYRRLAGGDWPPDIREIAAHFQAGSGPEPAPAPSAGRATTVFNQRGQHVGQQINVAGNLYAGVGPPGAGLSRSSSASESGAVSGAAGAGWSSETIRRLLLAAFNDEELRALCFDHFGEVYDELSAGMSKGQMVQCLLEHCVRHGQTGRLLDLVRERNPVQYERWQPRGEG
jgi:hypothetical protein